MSLQSARDFLAKAAKDEGFRNGLSACKTAADQRQFALASGFEFTSDELAAARGELQDADLDVISGGIVYSAPCSRDIPPCIPFPG